MWSVAALILLLVAAYKASFNSADSGRPDRAQFAEADLPGDVDVGDVPKTADVNSTSGRPVYRYSVIPGGAYDPGELDQAIDRDPVVAIAYRSVAAKGVHAEVVPADRMAYMSYRIADKIYWTKHQIKLRRGETVLTNGETMLRGRCGNGISLDPMEPTAETDPAPMELEALAPGAPPLLDARRLPFNLVLQDSFTPGLNFVDNLGAYQGMEPLFTGGGLSGGTPAGPTAGNPPIDVPPVVTIPPDFPGVPPGHDQIIHQIIVIATGPPTDDGPPDDGPKFPPGGPDQPDNPVPTPEPTTMLLVGGGLVSLALRKRRSTTPND